MQTLHKDIGFIQKSRQWHLMDASDQVLGRLASRAASLLIGKHKVFFSHHLDCGDFVVVTNAQNVKLTGNKITQKEYFSHSGYPKGGKNTPVRKLLEERPERVVELAVKRMLPKNKLGSQMYTRLKVYSGSQHPHGSQNPKTFEL